MGSVLVYTVHKAASMFLHKLTSSVSREFGISYYSINHRRYQKNIKSNGWNALIQSKHSPSSFGPIRAGEARPYFPTDLQSYNIILHLRDPRDVLTSLFFSHVYSHRRKKGIFAPSDEDRTQWDQDGIDAYVELKTPEFKSRYTELCDSLVGLDNVTLIKYEDMVVDYGLWLKSFMSVFRHLKPEDRKILNIIPYPTSVDAIYDKMYDKYSNEFDVSSENIYKHKRQVDPGDHRRKLKPDTIDKLNHEFRPILDVLGYKVEVPYGLAE